MPWGQIRTRKTPKPACLLSPKLIMVRLQWYFACSCALRPWKEKQKRQARDSRCIFRFPRTQSRTEAL